MAILTSGFELQNFLQPVVTGAEEILFYFTVYSFLGWILENSYSFILTRRFFKANFLKGPFKPMYGIAPVMLICLITEKTHWAAVLFLCFFIPTLVEYISGYLLEKFFLRKWWDYSHLPLNLHGHICLPFSVSWLLLSLLCLWYLHPGIQLLYGDIEPYWSRFWPLAFGYFIMELIKAIQRHSAQALPLKERDPSMR